MMNPPPPNKRIADIQRELEIAAAIEFAGDTVVFVVSLAAMAAVLWAAAFIL